MWKIILTSALVCLAFPRSGRASVVTNCAQADLVTALNEGGMVTFACDGTIALTNTLTISQNTEIDGRGHRITISGDNAVRVFTINSNTVITVRNLTVADGRSGRGGAIMIDQGTLNLVDCTLSNNIATESSGGTAVGGARS